MKLLIITRDNCKNKYTIKNVKLNKTRQKNYLSLKFENHIF